MTLTELFTNIADAIRTKKGTSDKILASDFANEIENLPSGGGEKIPLSSAYYLFYKDVRNNIIDKINEYFDFSNCTDFKYMFLATTLTSIPSIYTGKGTDFSSMFQNSDYSIKTIPKLDMSNSINCNGMFYNCKRLTTLGGFMNLGKAYTQTTSNYSYYTLDISYSTNITYNSLMNVINNLYDLNLTYDVANGGTLYTQSLILGTKNKAKLTAEEIAIATSKRMVDFIKEELNMQYIGYTKPILLVADEGKKIRAVNDIYKPATEEEPEHIPYYTDVVFLADGITEQQAFEMYVEEVVE